MNAFEKIVRMKGKEKIVMLTAYDALFATLESEAGVDLILVGDSVANVLLGYPDTKTLGMNELLHHVNAVARAKPSCPIVADMPIHTYETPADAIPNARAFLGSGAHAVK
ncbi:MAG: 3-methyl-2-oxobutanoate hydroxymethyltransferase, partial [Candidatus Diapherotrites archaeon]|nr:3-methyl-2-oxobutanoate hydroxymethyltransferase [Candidatus Diapherotrites archaeon]